MQDKPAEAGLKIVERVNVSFGQFIQIVPDIFEFAFREAVRDTVAEDAELDIEIIPPEMRCLGCGAEYNPAEDLHAPAAFADLMKLPLYTGKNYL